MPTLLLFLCVLGKLKKITWFWCVKARLEESHPLQVTSVQDLRFSQFWEALIGIFHSFFIFYVRGLHGITVERHGRRIANFFAVTRTVRRAGPARMLQRSCLTRRAAAGPQRSARPDLHIDCNESSNVHRVTGGQRRLDLPPVVSHPVLGAARGKEL